MNNFRISIARLVVVDSAGVAIAEIDLRNGGILIGGGNIGKTSILNAIRLFLLPETNFKKSYKKFGFVNKDGDPYSDEDCYEHYFPSNSSFLILECENHLGGPMPHCQILYRGNSNSKDYRRMFTSLPFDEIRDLFWDYSKGEDGIGGAVENLSAARVKKSISKRDKYFKTVERAQTIKDVIYASNLLDSDAMRYCVFPLNKQDDANISSFRALVRLLFDMKTGADSVRIAIANIIESSKKEKKDELDFDIDAFINRNDQLGEKEAQLQKIKNMKPLYLQMVENYQKLLENQNAELNLLSFHSVIVQEINRVAKLIKEQDGVVQLAVTEQDNKQAVYESLKEQQQQITGAIQALNNKNRKLLPEIDKAKAIIDSYAGTPFEQIIETLKDELSKDIKKLENYQDASTRQSSIRLLKTDIKQGKRNVEELKNSLESQEFTLKNQLSDNNWLRFASINKSMANANPCRVLSKIEKGKIIEFISLLGEGDGEFQFFDKRLKQATLEEVENIEQMLSQTQDCLDDKEKELAELENLQNQNTILTEAEISTLKKKITQWKNELKRVEDYDFNNKTLENDEKDLLAKNLELETLSAQVIEAKMKYEEAARSLKVAKDNTTSNAIKLEKLKPIEQQTKWQIDRLRLSCEEELSPINEEIELTQEHMERLRDALDLKAKLRSEVVEALQSLIRDSVIENDDDLLAASLDDENLKHAYFQIQSRYEHLDNEIENMRNQYRSLRSEIHGVITELKQNRELISDFERFINKEFQQVSINDLSGVRASVEVDSKYDALLAEIVDIDLHAEHQLSSQFIDRLKSFADKFFNEGKAARLTMDKVVTGITYRVRKESCGNWESKSQSTSTIMLINIKLVETLLKKIRYPGCATYFPLVIDEGASVDTSQFKWLIPAMKESGFRVISASTNSASSELIFLFGHHFKLDTMRTAFPYHSERRIAFTKMPEGFLPVSEMTETQLCMFGELDE